MTIIGLGSGRCGTQSLSKLLNDCAYVHCTHERAPSLGWEWNEENYQIRLEQFKKQFTHWDVDLHYLPYVERFIEDLEKLKFVVLKRDRQEVIDSFDVKTKLNGAWPVRKKEWSDYFNIKKTKKKDVIGAYYDSYYKEIDRLLEKYPDKIKMFATDDLNTKQAELYEWCEIPEKDWRFKEKPVYNTIEQAIEYHKNHGVY